VEKEFEKVLTTFGFQGTEEALAQVAHFRMYATTWNNDL